MYGCIREFDLSTLDLVKHYALVEAEHRRRKIAKAAPVRPALSRDSGYRNFRNPCHDLIDRIVHLRERFANRRGQYPTRLLMGRAEWQCFAEEFCHKKYRREPTNNLKYMGMYVVLVHSAPKMLGVGL